MIATKPKMAIVTLRHKATCPGCETEKSVLKFRATNGNTGMVVCMTCGLKGYPKDPEDLHVQIECEILDPPQPVKEILAYHLGKPGRRA